MPFQPGHTLSRGKGRPKKADGETVRAMCRAATPEAFRVLARVMRGKDTHAALRACAIILDRGWGKCAPAVEPVSPAEPIELRWGTPDEAVQQPARLG